MGIRKTKKEIVKKILKQSLEIEDEQALIDLLIDSPIAVDVDKEEMLKLTLGERLADKLSTKAGSWGFIIWFSLFIIIWIIMNAFMLKKAIDPYPFILLNLLLSCLAALQAPIIMMSQNRQTHKDSIRNQNDYRTDLKSELILEELYKHVELLIKNQNQIISYLKEKGGYGTSDVTIEEININIDNDDK